MECAVSIHSLLSQSSLGKCWGLILKVSHDDSQQGLNLDTLVGSWRVVRASGFRLNIKFQMNSQIK